MNPIDSIPLVLVMLGATFTQVGFIEAGFRIGKTRQIAPIKAQTAQVRAIMGASLGLLAFMLAFSFSMAQQHFENRTAAYMLEISAVDSAFRGADLIDPSSRVQAKELLVNFGKLRLETAQAAQEGDMENLVEMVRESERMHDQLWAIAESAMEGSGDGEDTGIFAQSVLAMIDAHDARLQASFFNRVSQPRKRFPISAVAVSG